jgi:hypothetical protein
VKFLKPVKASEAQIEAAIRDYLHLSGWLTVKTDAALVVRGSGRPGVINEGDPDLRAFRGNRALHLETKSRTGKLSSEQRIRHLYLAQFGITVHVVRSVDDVKRVLEKLLEDAR